MRKNAVALSDFKTQWIADSLLFRLRKRMRKSLIETARAGQGQEAYEVRFCKVEQ